ncbi:hypothetical protein ACLF3G_10395 [Falsiroseomonas sp. HC035]|uniref:hypothetical protein n=1 Tax=Falsiroseomonas sp. HC035 TaxID=3390999 RepID=UPI003D321552
MTGTPQSWRIAPRADVSARLWQVIARAAAFGALRHRRDRHSLPRSLCAGRQEAERIVAAFGGDLRTD